MLLAVVITLIAFATSYAVTRAIIPVFARLLVDTPNRRSSHLIPTPKGGGIAIVCGVFTALGVGVLFGVPVPFLWVSIGAILIGIMGFVDDQRDLSPRIRFLIQIVIAVAIVVPSGGLQLIPLPSPLDFSVSKWFGIPLGVLWIVAVVNLYNFLDGIDGYAATQSVICGTAIFVYNPNNIGIIGAAIAGASLGFLIFNWHPARIFMGDVGSASLGFVFAALPFSTPIHVRSEFVFVMGMALWFFLADGVFTIIRRLLRGERITEAHRSHLYQRLVITGLHHNQVVTRIMFMALVLTSGTLVSIKWSNSILAVWIIFIFSTFIFLIIVFYTRHREKHSTESNRI